MASSAWSISTATRELIRNSLVGYAVFASGDSISQYLEHNETLLHKKQTGFHWDYSRSLSIGLLGIMQNGILLRVWYRTLDKYVSAKTDPKSVLLKICCDEVVFAPQLAASYLITSAIIQTPQSQWPRAVKENLSTKMFETWSNDLRVWPIANFVNFSLVPMVWRPIYASTVQLFWQVYLARNSKISSPTV